MLAHLHRRLMTMAMNPLLLTALLFLPTAPALAGKPAPNDPVRTHIVDAARQLPRLSRQTGTRLDIRRIWASARFGYLCTLLIDKDGQYARTAGAYEVHQIVLTREGDKWTPVAGIDGLSESLKHVQCASGTDGQITDAFLESVANNPSLTL